MPSTIVSSISTKKPINPKKNIKDKRVILNKKSFMA